jgi:glycosyltransferase involved in cell wall biosynthesis
VHDIIPLLFPEFHKKQYYYFKYFLPVALRKIKKIIVVSNHTKKLLVEYYNLEEEKIKVIYNGIVLPEVKEVKKENIILYVGRDSPTKNLELLVDAFNELNLKDYKLYLVGVNRKFKNKNIKSLGYVEDEELDMLYRKAKIFVLPSLYEGFGYPVIEAMARKTAVIASNVSALPEIGGNGAIYFKPYNKEELKDKINFLIKNEYKRKEFEEIGFKRSQNFSVNKMLKQYEEII